MKPGKSFNLSKTSKRMLAQFTDPVERNSWKKMMISAELTAATQPKTRDRQDARPQEPAAQPE